MTNAPPRAISRDLCSYLTKSKPESCVDNALWQSLVKEVELLELIMLKISCRPDGLLLLIYIEVPSEASFYTLYDYCTVKYLKQVGVDVKHADLGTEGIHSNGHMFFMEKNPKIADRVYKWLKKH
jgi:hypothetical protein